MNLPNQSLGWWNLSLVLIRLLVAVVLLIPDNDSGVSWEYCWWTWYQLSIYNNNILSHQAGRSFLILWILQENGLLGIGYGHCGSPRPGSAKSDKFKFSQKSGSFRRDKFGLKTGFSSKCATVILVGNRYKDFMMILFLKYFDLSNSFRLKNVIFWDFQAEISRTNQNILDVRLP